MQDRPVATLDMVELEVTEEPLPDPHLDRLPRAVRDRIEEIYLAVMGGADAEEYVAELESLVAEYPDVPKLHNYLALAYDSAGRSDEALALVPETFERFPDYVFAVSNYVRYCLNLGDIEEAGRVLDGRMLISQFARGRRRFHITEFLAYQGAVAEYLIAIGDHEAARPHVETLAEMAPDRPAVRQMQRQLSGGFSGRLWRG